jgi:hypothetical protein
MRPNDADGPRFAPGARPFLDGLELNYPDNSNDRRRVERFSTLDHFRNGEYIIR